METKETFFVKALYSYTPANSDELELNVNDIIQVIEETEEGWWKGILNGSVGMFPSNFVEVTLDPAGSSKSHPADSNERKHFQPIHSNTFGPTHEDFKDSKQTPAIRSENTNVPEPEVCTPSVKKLMANTDCSVPTQSTSAPELPPKPVREQAVALYPYEAQNEDELTLKEGDVITVISKDVEDKGWWKGDLNGQIGVFPDNFVKLIEDVQQKKPQRPGKPVVCTTGKMGKPKYPDKKPNVLPEKPFHKVPPAKPELPPSLKKGSKSEYSASSSVDPVQSHAEKKPSLSSAESKPDTFPSVSSEGEISVQSPEKAHEMSSARRSRTVKDYEVFDGFEPSSAKLVHLTANRAKLPNKRPPTSIFLKESGKRSKEAKDKVVATEPLGLESSPKPAVEQKPPSHPHPQEQSLPAPGLPSAGAMSTEMKLKLPEKRSLPPRPATSAIAGADVRASEPSGSPQSSDLDVLRKEMALLKDKMVLKNEFNELLNQVNQLKEEYEIHKEMCKKVIDSLKQDLEKERKLRIAAQKEIEKIKICSVNELH